MDRDIIRPKIVSGIEGKLGTDYDYENLMTETSQDSCSYPFDAPKSVSDVINEQIQSKIDALIAADSTLKPDYDTTTYADQLKSVNHYSDVLLEVMKTKPSSADYQAASLAELDAAWADRMNGGGNVFEYIIPNDPKKPSLEPSIIEDFAKQKLARQKAATDGNYNMGGYYHLDSVKFASAYTYYLDIWFMQDNVNSVYDTALQVYNQYRDPYITNSNTAPTTSFCCLSGAGTEVSNFAFYISGVGRTIQWEYDTDGVTKKFQRIVEGKLNLALPADNFVRYFDNAFTYKNIMFFGWMGQSFNLSYKYITFNTTMVENYGYNTKGSTSTDMSATPDTVEEFTDFDAPAS